MKVSVIINNYNYEEFILESVESVLSQDNIHDFISEIVIVDDGSTDASLDKLKKYKDNKYIKIVKKSNAGQLSAFNKGFEYISGDIVCFLDSDDLYKKDYVKKIVNFYKKYVDCDLLIVRKEFFGDENYTEESRPTGSLGFSLLRSYYLKAWIGTSTSAFSIKKNILSKILPLSLESDWIVRADDCIVWGSSLVGAKKYYLNDILVRYRVHGSNCYYGKEFNNDYNFRRTLNINRLFKEIIEKNKIVISHKLFRFEYLSIANKQINDIIVFSNILILLDSNTSFFTKLKLLFFIIRNYKKRLPPQNEII
ncbi:MAG: glycosyltransferase [Desulfamplus sp.]|nr:glycosyltransferase [Desulfamplus sp.]